MLLLILMLLICQLDCQEFVAKPLYRNIPLKKKLLGFCGKIKGFSKDFTLMANSKSIEDALTVEDYSYKSYEDDQRVDNFEPQFEIDARIVGGLEVEVAIPWFAHLKIKTENDTGKLVYNCGASAITSKYLLSAGHCFCFQMPHQKCKVHQGYLVTDYKIKVLAIIGVVSEETLAYAPKEERSKRRIRKISRILVHKDFRFGRPNDIALLEMESSLPPDELSAPVCMPAGGRFPDLMKNATVVGMGYRWNPKVECSTVGDGPSPFSPCKFPFYDNHQGRLVKYHNCERNHQTPSSKLEICKEFHSQLSGSMPDRYVVDIKHDKNVTRCYDLKPQKGNHDLCILFVDNGMAASYLKVQQMVLVNVI